MCKIQLDSQNYPAFMELLQIVVFSACFAECNSQLIWKSSFPKGQCWIHPGMPNELLQAPFTEPQESERAWQQTLVALVFLDQYMKATLTQIIQQMSCKPDGKLKNMYFFQEETKPF